MGVYYTIILWSKEEPTLPRLWSGGYDPSKIEEYKEIVSRINNWKDGSRAEFIIFIGMDAKRLREAREASLAVWRNDYDDSDIEEDIIFDNLVIELVNKRKSVNQIPGQI